VDEESVRVRAQGGDQGEVPYEIFVDLHHALPFSLLAPHERGDGQAEAKLGEDAQLNEHARVGQDEDGVVEVLRETMLVRALADAVHAQIVGIVPEITEAADAHLFGEIVGRGEARMRHSLP